MTHATTTANLQTVHDAFATTAARTPDAPFLCVEAVTAQTYGIPAGEISWRDAAGEVASLCGRYAAAGYGHGHRVGLMLENRPAFLYHWFALNALGASAGASSPATPARSRGRCEPRSSSAPSRTARSCSPSCCRDEVTNSRPPRRRWARRWSCMRS